MHVVLNWVGKAKANPLLIERSGHLRARLCRIFLGYKELQEAIGHQEEIVSLTMRMGAG